MKTKPTLVLYKPQENSFRWAGMSLSFEIRITIHGIVSTVLPEETALDLNSLLKFLIDLTIFDQFQGEMRITRH